MPKSKLSFALFFLMVFTLKACFSQEEGKDSLSLKTRRTLVFGTQGVIVLGSLVALNSAWYSEYQSSDFHFFNDNEEWLQMDKWGHATTAHYLSDINYKVYSWAGYTNKQATWMGAGITVGFLTAVEVMDGFSNGWGFSWGDFTSNIIGAGLFSFQQLHWKEQRILLKFSYAPSEYASLRSELLGEGDLERMLKDYNGQTYWVSVNPHSFFAPISSFPKWLNIALGYSASGMLGGDSNQGLDYDFSGIERKRHFLFSPDIDLTRIPTQSKFLKTVFYVLRIVKIPLPTLEYIQGGKLNFYWFYF